MSAIGDLDEVDELMVRPFATDELELRIARARRDTGLGDEQEVRAGAVVLNSATYEVRVDGRAVDFAHKEFELLRFLMTHPDVFPRGALLAGVWGYDYYGGSRTVDVHVRRIRASRATSTPGG